MKRRAFQTVWGCVLALSALTVPQLALAQAWPGKQPIKLVAVFPPGGSVDQVARIWRDWHCGRGASPRRWLHLCGGV
jgi:tripartite-type tricarboxylate transporter receptor subunit TctC